MKKIILYGTVACHLCEEAEAILKTFQSYDLISIEHRDIVDDEDWLRLYRVRIPVVAYGDKELGWPFDQQQFLAWLKSLD